MAKDRSGYHKEWRNGHLANGVCPNHPDRLVVVEKTMCKECLGNKMSSYHKHKANGVCPNHIDRKVSGAVVCEECAERKRAKNKHNKLVCLSHYSIFTTKPMCAVPGCLVCDTDILTIDHIDGGGTQHREKIGGGGSSFYLWLIRNNFPEGYQVLCWNHNLKKEFNNERASK